MPKQVGPGFKDNSSGQKMEPKPRAMSPGAVSEIGLRVVRTVPQPMHEGRGFKAPMNKSQSSNRGSQGRY